MNDSTLPDDLGFNVAAALPELTVASPVAVELPAGDEILVVNTGNADATCATSADSTVDWFCSAPVKAGGWAIFSRLRGERYLHASSDGVAVLNIFGGSWRA